MAFLAGSARTQVRRRSAQDGNETVNIAADPRNAVVLAAMKEKLKKVLAPLDTPFAEFKPAAKAP